MSEPIEPALEVSELLKCCSNVRIKLEVCTLLCWTFMSAQGSAAVDIWSAGVILLAFLTKRFPFFVSSDDTEALLEIATIFGKDRMEQCAALHSERLSFIRRPF